MKIGLLKREKKIRFKKIGKKLKIEILFVTSLHDKVIRGWRKWRQGRTRAAPTLSTNIRERFSMRRDDSWANQRERDREQRGVSRAWTRTSFPVGNDVCSSLSFHAPPPASPDSPSAATMLSPPRSRCTSESALIRACGLMNVLQMRRLEALRYCAAERERRCSHGSRSEEGLGQVRLGWVWVKLG